MGKASWQGLLRQTSMTNTELQGKLWYARCPPRTECPWSLSSMDSWSLCYLMVSNITYQRAENVVQWQSNCVGSQSPGFGPQHWRKNTHYISEWAVFDCQGMCDRKINYMYTHVAFPKKIVSIELCSFLTYKNDDMSPLRIIEKNEKQKNNNIMTYWACLFNYCINLTLMQ